MTVFARESAPFRLERDFAEALLNNDAPVPAAIKLSCGAASLSRFGVYRNNVIASLIRALASRYPVTRRLLWPDTFDGIARLYVVTEPPRSPILSQYGKDFPQFLRSVGEGAAAQCVADVAAIENARTCAYHAADAVPLAADLFTHLSADDVLNLRLTMHPSAILLCSRFPAVSIWQAYLRDDGEQPIAWKPEGALVVRPHFDVEVWDLPPGTYEFFAAIAKGETVGAAAAATASSDAFDLATAFRIMICAGIVTGMAAAAGPHA
ncbi:DNA-binding domain-containing protein [Pseudorhodoplanes sinuspersici]|uniref:Uncharacterized protein n=1 Tax=Pseudorhodoplanes sinuspersici TaxID=1235591 RepID=A0A1W6ZKW3_9HYPH|nr:DNA-binding domain-containing protein [Pseudorhodoplanes sinuspersici]ARP97877.1 hypothetical protein CAK95_01355 [Pseudorhodoplanes sinuspersici]RKE68386.1 putative DNA-binding protein [Pseudorhodoplanes sinuspersici]